MKKLVFCFFLCTILFNGVAQTDSKIVAGSIETISSKILNEDRKVWVYVPHSESNDVSSPSKYPVVYLLDGDLHFYSVVGMLQQLSYANGNTICPEMIVVGIPNTDRTRDLTPTHVSGAIPFMGSNFAKTSGGGERFISFIEKELMPFIESKYPVEPYKMLIGHSLGGLTVMNTLINHPDLFNAYVAIDPSMWWDDRKLMQQAEKVLSDKSFQGKSLFLGIANSNKPGVDTSAIKSDTTRATFHFRSVLKTDELLKRYSTNGLRYCSKYYKDENHSSAPLMVEYDAFHFIFDYYGLRLTREDFMNFNLNTLEQLKNHYELISKNLGYTVKCPEMVANGLGYALLGQQKFKESEQVFSMNVRNYPNSFNVYDSMGDFYDATGEKAKAIDSYKKALSIKEFPDTRVKLDALLKK